MLDTPDSDGGSWVDIGPVYDKPEDTGHNENLAETLPEHVLDGLATDLLLDIEADDRSRAEWLQMREQAIGLLAIKLARPRGDMPSSPVAT